ncbi:MAG: hypothetical protein ACFB21_03945 [Opitutales bacterium]
MPGLTIMRLRFTTSSSACPTKSRRGFAMLAALGTMAFVFLMLMSLVALMRTEYTGAEVRSERLRAREAARLALAAALGRLSEAAGPDQRATATAEILGPPDPIEEDEDEVVKNYAPEARFWTGVWDTSDPDGEPVWLVSGTGVDGPADDDWGVSIHDAGQTFRFAPRIQYFDADGDAVEIAEVRVPVQAISNEVAIAYWISDEGQKSDLGWQEPSRGEYLDHLADELSVPPISPAATLAAQLRLQQESGAFEFIEILERDASADNLEELSNALSDEVREGLLNMAPMAVTSNLASLGSLLGPDAAPEFGQWAHRYQHSYAPATWSVLTNTLDGGLRYDLTHFKRLGFYATEEQIEEALPVLAEAGEDENEEEEQDGWRFVTPGIAQYLNFANEFGIERLDQGDPWLPAFVPADYMSSNATFAITPMIPEMVMAAGFARESGKGRGASDDFWLYFYVFADFWNPFGQKLLLDNGFGSWPGNPIDVMVHVRGLPSITITNQSEIDQGTGGSATAVIPQSQMPELLFGINSFDDHPAGYMRANSRPSGSYGSSPGGDGVTAVKMPSLNIINNEEDDYTITFGESDLEIMISALPRVPIDLTSLTEEDIEDLSEFVEETTDADSDSVTVRTTEDDAIIVPALFQRITLENYGNFTIEYSAGDNENDDQYYRFVRNGSDMSRDSLKVGLNTFGFHYRFIDDWSQFLASGSSEYLALEELFNTFWINRREIEIDMSTASSQQEGHGFYVDVLEGNIDQGNQMVRTNFLRDEDVFYSSWSSSQTSGKRYAVFHDLPIHEPLNVTVLNGMTFRDAGLRPLGRYYDSDASKHGVIAEVVDVGRELNTFFDRFFFSSLPSNPSELDAWDRETPLLQSRLEYFGNSSADVDDLASFDSAKAFMMRGGLNINSLSETLWRDALRGRDHASFRHGLLNSGGGQSLLSGSDNPPDIARAFFSRPASAHLALAGPGWEFVGKAQETEFSDNDFNDGTDSTLIQSVRELSEKQVHELARNLRHELWQETTDMERPFITVSEFINSGVMQRAIDAVPDLNEPGTVRIPNGAPAFFSQVSILNALSSRMFARSDTFRIRAAGIVRDELTGVVSGEAVCEALVRRTPEPTSEDPDRRRFQLISFRWLSPDELSDGTF